MIGLDTNVLVRYLVQDDPAQAERANRLIDGLDVDRPGFISLLTLAELVWVLQRAYGYRRDLIARTLQAVLTTAEFHIESRGVALAALDSFEESGADYADCLIGHLAERAGCATVYTFDRRSGRLATFQVLD